MIVILKFYSSEAETRKLRIWLLRFSVEKTVQKNDVVSLSRLPYYYKRRPGLLGRGMYWTQQNIGEEASTALKKKFVSVCVKRSALFFNVDLIVHVGLQMFQPFCLSTHDLIWGFHEPVVNKQMNI